MINCADSDNMPLAVKTEDGRMINQRNKLAGEQLPADLDCLALSYRKLAKTLKVHFNRHARDTTCAAREVSSEKIYLLKPLCCSSKLLVVMTAESTYCH